MVPFSLLHHEPHEVLSGEVTLLLGTRAQQHSCHREGRHSGTVGRFSHKRTKLWDFQGRLQTCPRMVTTIQKPCVSYWNCNPCLTYIYFNWHFVDLFLHLWMKGRIETYAVLEYDSIDAMSSTKMRNMVQGSIQSLSNFAQIAQFELVVWHIRQVHLSYDRGGTT